MVKIVRNTHELTVLPRIRGNQGLPPLIEQKKSSSMHLVVKTLD